MIKDSQLINAIQNPKNPDFLKTLKVKIKHHHRGPACLKAILKGRDSMMKLNSAYASSSISWPRYLTSVNLTFLICEQGWCPPSLSVEGAQCYSPFPLGSGFISATEFNNFRREKRPRKFILLTHIL